MTITLWQFTVQEYEQMFTTGLLPNDARVELIDGEIRAMPPIGMSHVVAVLRLDALLHKKVGDITVISVQNPLRLSDYTMPEPDVVVLRPDPDYYKNADALRAEDVLLLIEVSDSTLAYDRNEKLPRYAAAGIAEVWIVDVNGETIEQYVHPQGDTYQYRGLARRGNEITAAMLPLTLKIEDIFG